jgi:molybdate transport system substrate-binding protein
MSAGATLNILSTTAMKAVLEELRPRFESTSGCQVDLKFGPSGALAKRLAEGEAADLLIVAEPEIAALKQAGTLTATSPVICRSGIGVAVRRGAPKPDISSPEAFKRALLAAKAVSFSDPTRGGQSGIAFMRIVEQLGIASEVKAKAKMTTAGPGGLVGAILSRGEAEIGVQQIPELIAFEDVELVGPLPDELQCPTAYVAGIPATAANAEAAKSLIALLTAPGTAAIIRAKGMAPG